MRTKPKASDVIVAPITPPAARPPQLVKLFGIYQQNSDGTEVFLEATTEWCDAHDHAGGYGSDTDTHINIRFMGSVPV